MSHTHPILNSALPVARDVIKEPVPSNENSAPARRLCGDLYRIRAVAFIITLLNLKALDKRLSGDFKNDNTTKSFKSACLNLSYSDGQSQSDPTLHH